MSNRVTNIFPALRQGLRSFLLSGLLLPGVYFLMATTASAQQYSLRDQAEIQYQAQLTLMEWESILNLISNAAISGQVLEDAMLASYSDPNSRIFWSAEVLIDDNLAPSAPAKAGGPGKKVRDYIAEFDKVYVKSELETVDFYGFQLSNLKQSDYLYLRVKYTTHFRGRHLTDPVPYKPADRLAEMRAEKRENRWVTYITRITFYDPAQALASTTGDVKLITAAADDGQFVAKLHELREAQRLQEQQMNQAAAAIALSWSTFDNKRFEDIRRQGSEAEAKRDYTRALELYQQALLVKPKEPGVEASITRLNKSIQQRATLEKKFIAGEYVEAIKAYGQAIASDPDNPDLYNGRGKSYEKLNELQSAQRDFTTAIRLDPKFAAALHNRASLFLRMGEPKKALEDYNQIIKSGEDASAYYPERAKVKVSLGDHKGAIEDYEAAIKLKPRVAALHYQKGLLHYQQKQTQQAIRSFTEALEQDSLLADAYFHRGQAYADLQNISSAAMDFESARRTGIGPEQTAAIDKVATSHYASGETALRKGQYKPALESFIKAVLLSPANEMAWVYKGDAHFQLQDYDNALQSYTKAIGIDKISTAYYKRGLVYRQLKKHQLSRHDFEQFVPLGWQLVSRAESKAGNPQSALSLEQVAEEIAEAWYMLGMAQLLSEQYNDASASLDKALDINKGHAQALFARGAAQLGLKNYKKAIRDLEKSLKSGVTDNPWLYLALGDSYLALGQTDYAISIYAYIIDSVDKGFDLAYIHRANAYKSKKQFQLALQDLNLAITHNEELKKDAEFITSKGLIELYESKFQEASQSFDQALSLEQNHAWALYGKASVLASQNKMEESLDLYRKAFESGKIEWSAIKDDPIIKHVSKQKAFKEMLEASLRM